MNLETYPSGKALATMVSIVVILFTYASLPFVIRPGRSSKVYIVSKKNQFSFQVAHSLALYHYRFEIVNDLMQGICSSNQPQVEAVLGLSCPHLPAQEQQILHSL